MAEIDPSIALAGRPLKLPDLDVPKTLLTLGQLRHLSVLDQAAREEAARKQTAFDQTGAQGAQYLRALTQGPLPPAQAPALAPPDGVQSTPAPLEMPTTSPIYPAAAPPDAASSSPPGGAPPAAEAPRPHIMDAALQQEVLARFPHGKYVEKAMDVQAKNLENGLNGLKLHAQSVDEAGRGLTDGMTPAQYQTWLKWAQSMVDPRLAAQLPPELPPEGVAPIRQQLLKQKDVFDQGVKRMELAISQQGADTAEYTAKKTLTYVPTASGLPIGRPTTGEPTPLPTGPDGTPTLPTGVTTPEQAARSKDLSDGWRQSQQQFVHQKQAYRQMTDAAPLKTGAGDRIVVNAFQALIADQGTATPGPGAPAALGLGTLSQQAQGEIARLFQSGTALTDPVRAEIVTAAKAVHDGHVAQHRQMRTDMLALARELKVPNPETVIPDLSVDAPTTLTRAQIHDMAQRKGIPVAEMEKIIRDAGDKILP